VAHFAAGGSIVAAVSHVAKSTAKSTEDAAAYVGAFAAEWRERSERFAWVRALTDAQVSLVIRRIEFLRKLRGMRGTASSALNRSPSSSKKDPGKIRPLFSNIVAGKYPAHQNYRCRLFQVDVIVLPYVEVVQHKGKWRLIRPKFLPNGKRGKGDEATPRNTLLLTCVCVGTRFALAEIVKNQTKGSHADADDVLKAFKVIFEKILRTFDERLEWESKAEQGEYYEPDNFDADVPFYTDERALIRPLPPSGTHRETWLSALELLTEHATERREVRAPWERTKPRIIFMSDAGDFKRCALWLQRPQNIKALWDEKVGDATSIPFDVDVGYPDDHPEWQRERVISWCVVNKSAVRRLSMQIVERFHRTLRAMLAIYYKLYTRLPTQPPDKRQAIARAIRSYNDSFHRTTKLPPVELWRGLPRGTCADERLVYPGMLQPSRQRPTFASLESFGRGSRVEALAGKDDMANKQQVHRTPGLLVEDKNHCTLELRPSGVAWLLEAELAQISRVARGTVASDEIAEAIPEAASKYAAAQTEQTRRAALVGIIAEEIAARYAARSLRCTGVTEAAAMWHARRVARQVLQTYPDAVVEHVGALRRGLTDDLVVRLIVVDDTHGFTVGALDGLLGGDYVFIKSTNHRSRVYVAKAGPGEFWRLVEIYLTQTKQRKRVSEGPQNPPEWLELLVLASAPPYSVLLPVAPTCKAQLEGKENHGLKLHDLKTPYALYVRLGFGHLACARDHLTIDGLRDEQATALGPLGLLGPQADDSEPGASAVAPVAQNGPLGDCGTGPEGNAFYDHATGRWVHVWRNSPVPPWMLRHEA
jgi:hypothetical protein